MHHRTLLKGSKSGYLLIKPGKTPEFDRGFSPRDAFSPGISVKYQEKDLH
jgi:hypothetical protein